MEFHHIPVLFDEVMEWMQPRADGVYADGTLGGGGHSEGILHLSGGTATLYGIDRDEDAIRAASERLKIYPGFHAIHGNFHDAKALLTAAGAPPLTGALLDLGVSSHQLDEGDRGFSYHEDAPLDMRMDQSTGLTAAEYLAQVTPEEFRRILTDYGEEKWAARIAQIFAEKRAQKPIETTADLVAVVDAAIPKAVRRKDDGPADVSGGAYRRERRAGSAGKRAAGFCGAAGSRRAAAGHYLPFAGRPHRQKYLPGHAASLHLSAQSAHLHLRQGSAGQSAGRRRGQALQS